MIFLYQFNEIFSIFFLFIFTYATDIPECFYGSGAGGAEQVEHLVRKHYIGGERFLVGKAFPELAQGFKQLSVFCVGQSQWQFRSRSRGLALASAFAVCRFFTPDHH